MAFLSQPITLQTVFGTKRQIGPLSAQVVLNEHTTDTLTITKQPVQQGASITDHAYKEPVSFAMNILLQDNALVSSILGTFNSNGLAQLYQRFIDLQNSRVPFNIITPKRIYRNMLIASLGQTTDKTTEKCLSISLTFQEVIIVTALTVSVPRRNQKNPGKSGATQPAGKKSALLSLREGIGALVGVK